jgi:hypothetical protein
MVGFPRDLAMTKAKTSKENMIVVERPRTCTLVRSGAQEF